MTKEELIRTMEGLMDETDIRIWNPTSGVTDVAYVRYVPSKNEEPAYLLITSAAKAASS